MAAITPGQVALLSAITISPVTGTLAETLDAVTLTASGTVINPVTGTLAETLDALTLTASGTVSNPDAYALTATIRETNTGTIREGKQMRSPRFTYAKGAERPGLELWIQDRSGTLIDFSSGYTFELTIGSPGDTPLLTKSSGISGATGSGVEPSGSPNVVVTWAADELDITPGIYGWWLTASTTSLDRIYAGKITITPTTA